MNFRKAREHKFGGHHGHPHRGPRRFGAMMEQRIKGKFLSSAEMNLLVLDLLKEGSKHGYEIIKSVEDLTNGVYAPSPGMVYPLLSYLVEIEHANCTQDGNRKTFTITQIGNEFLSSKQSELDAIKERLKIISDRLNYINDQMSEETLSEENWGRHKSGEENIEMRLKFRNLRHELKSILFNKRSASIEEKQRVLEILQSTIDQLNNTPKEGEK